MCLLILNVSKLLPKKYFTQAWNSNSDGAGIAWNENNEVHTKKCLYKKDLNGFYDYYKKVRAKTDSPIIIHFRIETSGGINDNNTHPFRIGKNTVFAHNGVIPNLGGQTRSDTNVLCQILGFFNISILEDYGWVLQQFTNTCKFAFINNKGEYYIHNEKLGNWDNGDWFSNDSYKTRSYYFGNTKIDDYYKRDGRKVSGWNSYALSCIEDEEEEESFQLCSMCDNIKEHAYCPYCDGETDTIIY